MDKIGSYGVYHNNYYDRPQAGKNQTAASSKAKSTKNNEPTKVQLSNNAVNLLKELKKTYGDTDFIVADYETDEEAAAYLSRGRSMYSVLITPEELEKMAADESVKNENLKVLDEAFAQLDQMKEKLGEKGEEVSRLGISIGNDGEISYFAELEKVSEKQRERIEEKRESNREKTREESIKRTTVQASSVEDLLARIGQVDWNEVPDDRIPSGHKFDYTI